MAVPQALALEECQEAISPAEVAHDVMTQKERSMRKRAGATLRVWGGRQPNKHETKARGALHNERNQGMSKGEQRQEQRGKEGKRGQPECHSATPPWFTRPSTAWELREIPRAET